MREKTKSAVKTKSKLKKQADRFERARGKADIPWRTNTLMRLLRGKD